MAKLEHATIHKTSHMRDDRQKNNMLSILCIMVFVISWVANMGWIRFAFAIPMAIHAIVFFFSNRSYHKHITASHRGTHKLNTANRLIYVTYTLAYVLLPDGGDTSDSARAVFGLIKSGALLNIAGVVSELLLITNVVLLINQTVSISKLDRGEIKPL